MRILLIALVVFCSVSCTNDPPKEDKKFEVATPANVYSINVVYTDAQVYTGTTRYVFKDKTGKRINVDIPNSSQGGTKVYLPGNLLENTNQGPPTANPHLLGQSFVLDYDRSTNKVIAVKPKPEEK